MTDEQDQHDLVGAYVVDAVDDVERARFERHLEDCLACQQEVRELRDVLPMFAEEPAAQPPTGLRDAILTEVASTPQRQRGAQHARASRSHRPWWAAVAAAAVVAVGAWGVSSGLFGEASPVDEVVQADDAATRSAEVGDGEVTVVASASRGEVALVAEGLAPPPSGHDYQAWFIHADGTIVSAGVMPRIEQDGAEMVLQGSPAGATQVGITVEPAGGSEQPTTEPIAAVSLRS